MVGYEHRYEINESGVVRRMASGSARKARVLKWLTGTPYPRVCLYSDDRKGTSHLVHRLVYQTFVGPIPPELEINHINGNKHDNRLANLELVTPSQNVKHAYQMGLKRGNEGLSNPQSRLTAEQVRQIRHAYVPYRVSAPALAKRFGVTDECIMKIVKGVSYRDVQ